MCDLQSLPAASTVKATKVEPKMELDAIVTDELMSTYKRLSDEQQAAAAKPDVDGQQAHGTLEQPMVVGGAPNFASQGRPYFDVVKSLQPSDLDVLGVDGW